MRKNYVKPALISEEFVPQTYVAVCKGQVKWSINCNVPDGYGYIDNNEDGNYDSDTDTLLTPSRNNKPQTVWGCGETHDDVVLPEGQTPYQKNAMWHPTGYGSGSDFAVFYWRDGTGSTDIHFTKGNAGDAVKNMS